MDLPPAHNRLEDDSAAGPVSQVPPDPACAVCGSPMALSGPEGGCLHCLLATGSGGALDEADDNALVATLSESAAADLSAPVLRTRFGHFEITRHPDGSLFELGRGAMGVSYLGRDTMLDCQVALKVIDARLSARRDAQARFLREARAAARLRHPNVASVFHYGEEGGQCFYAMEFIEGETLEARVRRDGPLSPSLALEVAQQVTRALVAADARGVVHRDLKPSNLMVTAGDQSGGGTETPVIKVIDFGLAKAVVAVAGKDGSAAADLTRGGFVGTPAFASPEQFAPALGEEEAPAGRGSGAIDIRSDIYSLGVTLWYLLTGKVPFVGRTLTEIHDRQLHRPLPFDHLLKAQVPAPVVNLLRRMLAADPGERPQSPRQLAEDLQRCREQVSPRTGPAAARRERIALAVGIAALLVAAVAVAAWWSGRLDPAGRPNFPSATKATSTVPGSERSVAVLPFENLSDEKSIAFFADGIQDDLITSLGKLKNLRIIPRSVVMGYRGTTGAERLRAIGQELGVERLLEGSVRRLGDRWRVSVRLLDAGDLRQLWAETYDRAPAEAVTLQGQLAVEVSEAIGVRLTPEERATAERRTTGSPEAYGLYLRGREYFSRVNATQEDQRTAEDLFARATRLDPRFAIAWAWLARARAVIVNREPTDQNKAAALTAGREAVRLQPDLGVAHLALAQCLSANADTDAAAEEAQAALRLLPDNASVLSILAGLRVAQGRFEEARWGYERAIQLAPRDPILLSALHRLEYGQRDWPEAARTADRLVELAPDSYQYRLWQAWTEFNWKGNAQPIHRVVETVPAREAHGAVHLEARYTLAMFERDWTAAVAAVAAGPEEGLDLVSPRPLLLAKIRLARRAAEDLPEARRLLDEVRPELEKLARENPTNQVFPARLAILLACLGEREMALVQAHRARELVANVQEHEDRTWVDRELAEAFATLGDADRAVLLLDHLLRVPNVDLDPLSLRFDPIWDPIRGDAGFQKLVATMEATVPLQ